MDGFEHLAGFYDQCVGADYDRMADYIEEKINMYVADAHTGADIGCGSGTLTRLLSQRGYSMTGVDCSDAMLSEAVMKNDQPSNIVFSLQDMVEFELPYENDFIVSTLDCLNYLSGLDEVRAFLQNCASFLKDKGILIFDLNTLYKYEQVLDSNSFVYETDQAFFVWENEFDGSNMYYDLTYFVKNGDMYQRYEDHQVQTYYELSDILSIAEECGFIALEQQDDYSDKTIGETTQRVVLTLQKRSI